MTLVRLGVGLLLLALAAPAAAAPIRVAILDVKAVGYPESSVEGLVQVMANAITKRMDAQVVSSADLRAMAGVGKKNLLSCQNASCLAEIGGALGLDWVLVPEVAELGGDYLLSISAFSVRRGRPVARTTKHQKFLQPVIEAAGDTAVELLQRATQDEVSLVARRKKFAVLDVVNKLSDVPGAAGLSSLVAAQIFEQPDAYVLGAADVHAVLGADQKHLLECAGDSPACLIEIGGALGVNYVISTETSRLSNEYVVSLAVVDILKGAVVGRVAKRVEHKGNLVDAARLATKEALFDLGLGVGGEAPAEAVATGTMVAPRVVGHSAAFGWVMVGTGLVAIAGGAWLWMGASQVEANVSEGDLRDATLIQAANVDRGMSVGLGAGGLGLVGFGTAFLLGAGDP